MDEITAGIIVVAILAIVILVGIYAYRRKASFKIKGPFGIGAEFEGENEPSTTEPTQAGSGAHAEGAGATAVGGRGVNVGGSVGGDVVTGEKVGGDKAGRDVIKDVDIEAGEHGAVSLAGPATVYDQRQFHIYETAEGEKRVPLQLPSRAEHFTGREDDLARLSANLQPGRTETIVGPGGMGKSALAAEALWRLHQSGDLLGSFPDGLVFHTFYNQPEADAALERIAEAFGVDVGGSPSAAAQQALSGITALLLLDGTEAADDLPAVLAVRGGCGVLITTRQSKDAPGDWVQLGPLTQDDALRLLRKWAGRYRAREDLASTRVFGTTPARSSSSSAIRISPSRVIATTTRGSTARRALEPMGHRLRSSTTTSLQRLAPQRARLKIPTSLRK